MQGIIIATLVVAVIGLIIGIALVAAGKTFHVETDERVDRVRENLPGNNCGACGYAGCDAVADAIVRGEAPVDACPVNSQEAVKKISTVMGVKSVEIVKKVAFVRCAGDCDSTSEKCNYVGINDCRAAALAGISIWECDYGCYGFGSCVSVCDYDAIHVKNGVAIVDKEKCMGCGKCAAACPRKLIELIPEGKKVAVRCSNHDRGPDVKKVCSAGCIGCKVCMKQCEHEAIQVEGNLAHIDYEKCVGCEKCAEKCVAKIITEL
ncbi:MAG: RnfABCDGE type electron transport complex subunit B [Lachnospiraceae bacterium]|nr:RnfABCDGE type electron transport complex subunit B [Lachnospiraceae bacterium]MDD3795814.1 RnfABCDGE type electron transport complex subunit B [Lachnospiraceae bacterium]